MDIKINLPLLFIINPVSGGGLGGRIAAALPEKLAAAGINQSDYRILLTRKDQDPGEVRQAAAGAETLIAVGGDGTVTEIATWLLAAETRPVFGLLPLGTSNDLSRVLGFHPLYKKRGWRGLLDRMLENKETQTIDLWSLNGKWAMLNYCSFGFDAMVADRFNKWRSKPGRRVRNAMLNRLVYILSGLSAPFSGILGKPEVIWYYGKKVGRFPIEKEKAFILCNIPSYAGGSNPSPEMKLDSGSLSLTRVRGLFNFLYLLITRFSASLARSYGAGHTRITADQLQITLDDRNFFQIDGEGKNEVIRGGRLMIEKAGEIRFIAV